MSVIFIEGFDSYGTDPNDINFGPKSNWQVDLGFFGAGTQNTLAYGPGRWATQNSKSFTFFGDTQHYFRSITRSFPETTTASFGFAFYLTDVFNWGKSPIITFLKDSTSVFFLAFEDTRRLIFQSVSGANTSVLAATSTGILTPGAWHYVEMEITTGNSPTGALNLWLDGVRLLNLSAQNITNGTAASINKVAIGYGPNNYSPQPPSNFPNYYVDDIYLTNTFGRLGERRVETLIPQTDGSTLNFIPSTGTSHVACINSANSNGSTYLSANVVGAVDQFTMSSLSVNPVNPCTIDAIQINTIARKTDAGTRAITSEIISGGVTNTGNNEFLTIGWSTFQRVLNLDPNGNTAWTANSVNALIGQPRITV